ncbi:tetratricopeptide repeat protein [Cytobacillus sp. FJAT-53684]|uniref:Tetratricopeptide repeat protein n=1 Tax=Cytobacillus mangrovibacter TaxID=3299024 RepID=A0ABW6JYH8_9BACI
MKKRDRKKLNDKVILFPDLEKRLLEKGLEKMKQKRFREAIDLFEEANQLEPENSDVHIGLVLAHFELGSLQKAKELANDMLQKGIGEYFQIIDFYLMILVQLHQYDEIVTTIEILLEEKEIPVEKYENFARMLEFSRRMVKASTTIEVEQAPPEDYDEEIDLFSYIDQQEQMMLAAKLAERNIRSYVDRIKNYLTSNQGDLFFKTLLLNVLSEHEYDKEIKVRKLDRELSVIPANLPAVHELPDMELILRLLSDQIEHDDPILFENSKSLINRHFFILYPFSFDSFKENVWAAAYHSLAAEYCGIQYSYEDFALSYQVKMEEMNQAHAFLMKLEEISYGNF